MVSVTLGTRDPQAIELPRPLVQGAAMAVVGLLIAMCGVIFIVIVIAIDPRGLYGVSFGIIGVLIGLFGIGMLAGGGRSLSGAPRLRATIDGVWFGGGSVIPWTAVKQVFESEVRARSYGIQAREKRASFTFHRRATMFRAPITCWFASLFSVGDIDVSIDNPATAAALLVARLDSVRYRAVRRKDPGDAISGRLGKAPPGASAQRGSRM